MERDLNKILREAKEMLPPKGQEKKEENFSIPDGKGGVVNVNIKTGENGANIHTNFNK